jgi:THAP4-like, heme-binding beta-barrel domain
MIQSRLILLIVTAALTISSAASQTPTSPNQLTERLGFLIGEWEGTAEGKPGKATVRRQYTRALNSRFIRAVHRGEYPVQEKNPKGEIHEEESFFSFDRARKRIVFRQFHVEGFVNTYVEEADSSGTKIVFTTEAIENIPAGWRARETYLVQGADQFEEIFELAEPGKPFEVYSHTRLKRVR